MKVFNCNPEWPICLYDFTFKNKCNQFLIMKTKRNLKDYVIEDYILPNGVDRGAEHKYEFSEHDVVRENSVHMCCNKNGQNDTQKKFTRNFKILFMKNQEFLFKNKNIYYSIDKDQDHIKKKQNFVEEIAGIKASDQAA